MKRISLAIMITCFASVPSWASINREARKAITESVSENAEVGFKKTYIGDDLKTLIETKSQSSFLQNYIYFSPVTLDGVIVNYAIIDSAMERTAPFTFLVLFTPDLKIRNVTVIRYISRYGSGIRDSRWLKQFEGKTAGSGFRLNSNIDSISGATISARSIADALERLSLLIPHLVK
jgi:Na+-translocating ferredoxin:NAD+ oxidoreductase RnfG subunit